MMVLFAGYNGAPRLFEVEIQSQFAGHTVTVFAHTGVYIIMQPADTCHGLNLKQTGSTVIPVSYTHLTARAT